MPRLLEFVSSLIQEYGVVLLFVVVLAGIIGFPIPDEGVLLFAGVLIAKGVMGFFPAFAVSASAVIAGSILNYRIGWWGGTWKVARWGHRIGFPVRRWKRTVRLIRKYGSWAVPMSYFVPGVRMGVSYAAGIFRIPFHEYVSGSLIGVISWVGLYLWLGLAAGSQW